jgi:hypothetical protein
MSNTVFRCHITSPCIDQFMSRPLLGNTLSVLPAFFPPRAVSSSGSSSQGCHHRLPGAGAVGVSRPAGASRLLVSTIPKGRSLPAPDYREYTLCAMPFHRRICSAWELPFFTTSTYRQTPLFLSHRFQRRFVQRPEEQGSADLRVVCVSLRHFFRIDNVAKLVAFRPAE